MISKEIENKSMVVMICQSRKCTGSMIHPGVEKYVPHGTIDCPDCKSVLLASRKVRRSHKPSKYALTKKEIFERKTKNES